MKITPDYIASLIADETYTRPGNGTLTVCVLTVQGGGTVVGHENVIDPATFDAALGRQYAREAAIKELWKLEGFHLKRQGGDLLVRAARAAYATIASSWHVITDADRKAIVVAARDCIGMQPEDDIPESVVTLTATDQDAARFALVARAVFGI